MQFQQFGNDATVASVRADCRQVIEVNANCGIAYGTTLSGVLNATATDGSTPVSGTFEYTATPSGGSASIVTTATVLGVGEYMLSLTFTPSSISYTSATGSVSLIVNKTTPSVALVSSANPALISTSVILTATVSSSAGTPTGSVDFYDGTTHLGSGTLSSGAATYATASLTAGTHSITAEYAGNSNFESATSSAVSQVVSDVSLDLTSGGSTSATVSAGGTATYHLTISPSSGSAFPSAVTLSASGGPTGATITITPQSITAGAAATNVTVTVQVPANMWALGIALPLLGMLALPFGMERRRRLFKRALWAGLLFAGLASTAAVLGCGGSTHTTSTTTTQPTNYTITVTAASGSVSHSTTLTLTVR